MRNIMLKLDVDGFEIHLKINELIFYKQLLKSQSQANFLGLYSRFRNDPALISPEQIIIKKLKTIAF